MEECNQSNKWCGYVDWRGRPAQKGRHGGLLAASFVLVVEILENLAFLANASNLVVYLTKYMHYSPSNSANIVTNFMGTAFLLALLGGFLSDAFFTTYCIYPISAAIEFIGLVLLTVQAHIPSLRPPRCESANRNARCQDVDSGTAAILFSGLYLVALGVGGIKGSLPPHGAEQFDEYTPHGRKQRSSFFNYYVFCLSCGALIAVTFVVWIEDNRGMQWGFGISTLTILLSIPIFLLGSTTYRIKIPTGSPITTMFKVMAAAIINSSGSRPPKNAVVSLSASASDKTNISDEEENHTDGAEEIQTETKREVNFLDNASNRIPAYRWFDCTTKQVEEVRAVLKILPFFMSTIMLNCCLAQLSTFSIQQAATMNTKIGRLKVSPASLPVFPVLFIMVLAPMYNHIIVPAARKLTKTEMGITHLQRIGTGLVMSIVAMATAALIEKKRKGTAVDAGLMNSTEPLPITFLWIAFQYLFLGSADLFTLAGMMDFFFTEAPFSMRSLATALSWASLAMGYYLSSVLVTLVNRVTSLFQHTPWLSGSNINHYHLERFYWLMCILSGLNFFNYLFWANRFKGRSAECDDQKDTEITNQP